MKLPTERNLLQTPKFDLFRSSSFFDKNKIRTLYSSKPKNFKKSSEDKVTTMQDILEIVSRIKNYILINLG